MRRRGGELRQGDRVRIPKDGDGTHAEGEWVVLPLEDPELRDADERPVRWLGRRDGGLCPLLPDWEYDLA